MALNKCNNVVRLGFRAAAKVVVLNIVVITSFSYCTKVLLRIFYI